MPPFGEVKSLLPLTGASLSLNGKPFTETLEPPRATEPADLVQTPGLEPKLDQDKGAEQHELRT